MSGGGPSSGAVWRDARWPFDGSTPRGLAAVANPCWLHFAAVLSLSAGVAIAAMLSGGVLPSRADLLQLPALLYWWIPPAAGIAAVTLPIGRHGRPAALALVGTGFLCLVALDLLGAWLGIRASAELVVQRGELVSMVARRTVHHTSWVTTVIAWATGGLPGVQEVLTRYPAEHPRGLLTVALAEAGAPFLLLGTLGGVLAVKRWVREKVTFQTTANEITALLVLAWLVAPLLSLLAGHLTAQRMSQALFTGGSLPGVLLPSLTVGLIGGLGLAFATRAGVRNNGR